MGVPVVMGAEGPHRIQLAALWWSIRPGLFALCLQHLLPQWPKDICSLAHLQFMADYMHEIMLSKDRLVG